jgi:hypothetical protein
MAYYKAKLKSSGDRASPCAILQLAFLNMTDLCSAMKSGITMAVQRKPLLPHLASISK